MGRWALAAVLILAIILLSVFLLSNTPRKRDLKSEGGVETSSTRSKTITKGEKELTETKRTSERETAAKRTETGLTGEEIVGKIPHTYHKPDNWNGRCIIFVHGLGGSKEKWSKDMEAFEREGYCTFSFDLPMHGERGTLRDPGKIPLVIKKGSDEVVLISKFLKQDGAKEVYLVARSLGSIVSGVALGKGASVEKAELLLAAANLKYVQEHGKVGPIIRDERVLREVDPLYFLPKYEGAVHFHCGKHDDLLTPEACQFAYEAASSASEREIFWHDTGHSMPLDEYYSEALAFFGSGSRAGEGAVSTRTPLLDLVEIPPTCGNGVCDASESWESCPFDCRRNVLLIGFQLHIEEAVRGKYYDEDEGMFRRYADVLDALARKFEEHGTKLSIQTEKNFALADVKFGRHILRELEERGHGIGVQSHLGHHIEELGLDTDEKRLEYNREVKEAVAKALGEEPTNLGGGFDLDNVNLLGVCDGCLGFTSLTAVEKPSYRRTHTPPDRLHPWILPPVSMLDLGSDSWKRHDPSGSIVYLPGWYLSDEFEVDCRRRANCFEAATESLMKALSDADADYINVWWASSHLYQTGASKDEVDRVLQAYERWFSGVVDPLVREGRVVWKTFDEMTEIYLRWEKARQRYESKLARVDHEFWRMHVDPDDPRYYVYFAVNVNDYYDPDLCAETLNRLLDIYGRYGVEADFYFTGPVLRALMASHPEVVERIREMGMGINYHLRPPHPACDSHIAIARYGGRCVEVADLPYDDKVRLLEGFERHALITSGYTPDRRDFCASYDGGLPGGYEYVKEVFGSPPVISGINTRDEELKAAELEVLRRMGLRMYVAYHVGGTDPENPFRVSFGLLERPSDFGLAFASELSKAGYDGGRMAELLFESAPSYDRPLFGAILVHDYDFYKKNWLKTPLLGKENYYSREEMERRFQAYEDLVKAIISTEGVKVVTGADIVSMYERYLAAIGG